MQSSWNFFMSCLQSFLLMFFDMQNSWSFFFPCRAKLVSFSFSCHTKLAKYLCFLLCRIHKVLKILPSKLTKLFYCYFLLCKAHGTFLFLTMQSSQNFSLSCHVKLEKLLCYLLCRACKSSSIFQLAFWTSMCMHLLCFVFNFLFLLSFRKIAQIFCNTFLSLDCNIHCGK